MAYNLIHNNPLIESETINPDVVVNYDLEKGRFYVTFIATNTGYAVERNTLVSKNFKYMDCIIHEILTGIDANPQLDVLFTMNANNHVFFIWNNN